ncbi:hypothetical protein ES703_67473 [subsurface metagenome]
MFYCRKCGEQRGWPTEAYVPQLQGLCEICREHAACFDVPSRALPIPVIKQKDEDSVPDETKRNVTTPRLEAVELFCGTVYLRTVTYEDEYPWIEMIMVEHLDGIPHAVVKRMQPDDAIEFADALKRAAEAGRREVEPAPPPDSPTAPQKP